MFSLYVHDGRLAQSSPFWSKAILSSTSCVFFLAVVFSCGLVADDFVCFVKPMC